MVKQPYDALEETDGFHVKRPKVDPPHMTLGELKMERPLEDANVKTAAAAKKPRMAAVPPIAIMALGTAMQTGAVNFVRQQKRFTIVDEVPDDIEDEESEVERVPPARRTYQRLPS
jgi:hypothetical protein